MLPTFRLATATILIGLLLVTAGMKLVTNSPSRSLGQIGMRSATGSPLDPSLHDHPAWTEQRQALGVVRRAVELSRLRELPLNARTVAAGASAQQSTPGGSPPVAADTEPMPQTASSPRTADPELAGGEETIFALAADGEDTLAAPIAQTETEAPSPAAGPDEPQAATSDPRPATTGPVPAMPDRQNAGTQDWAPENTGTPPGTASGVPRVGRSMAEPAEADPPPAAAASEPASVPSEPAPASIGRAGAANRPEPPDVRAAPPVPNIATEDIRTGSLSPAIEHPPQPPDRPAVRNKRARPRAAIQGVRRGRTDRTSETDQTNWRSRAAELLGAAGPTTSAAAATAPAATFTVNPSH